MSHRDKIYCYCDKCMEEPPMRKVKPRKGRKPTAKGYCILSKIFHSLEPFVFDKKWEAKKAVRRLNRESGLRGNFVIAEVHYFRPTKGRKPRQTT